MASGRLIEIGRLIWLIGNYHKVFLKGHVISIQYNAKRDHGNGIAYDDNKTCV